MTGCHFIATKSNILTNQRTNERNNPLIMTMVVEYNQKSRPTPFGPNSLRPLMSPLNFFLAIPSGGFLRNFANQISVRIPCLIHRSPMHFTTYKEVYQMACINH